MRNETVEPRRTGIGSGSLFTRLNKMKRIYSCIRTLAVQEEAQDVVEYALMAGFVAVVAASVMPNIRAFSRIM